MPRYRPDPEFLERQTARGGQKLTPSERGRALSRLAARQDNVVSLLQLYGLGFTYKEVRGLVAKGFLHPVHRGVFAVGHPKLNGRGHIRAAVLACGGTAFVDGRTAGADYGLCPLNLRAIEVTVVAATTPKRPGLIVHRTRNAPHRSEVRTRYGLRVATVPRLLVTLAPRATPQEQLDLITDAVRKGCLDFATMEETLERHAYAPGIATLKDVYARYRPGPDRKSELERSFDRYAAGDPRIPPYEKNVRMGPYEWDCYWLDLGLIVELDGRPYHRALADMDNDRAKDAWVQINAMSSLRITDFRWEYDRAGAVADLLALVDVRRRLRRAA